MVKHIETPDMQRPIFPIPLDSLDVEVAFFWVVSRCRDDYPGGQEPSRSRRQPA